MYRAAAIEICNCHKHLASKEMPEERVKITMLSARESQRLSWDELTEEKGILGLQKEAAVQWLWRETVQRCPVWDFWKMSSALRLLYSSHYLAISVTERITLQKPPCPPLPVLRWNLSSGLPFEPHFWWRVCNLKNCYKAKFITIIITIPMLTDGQLRLRECYLYKVTQEIYGRTMVRTQVSRAQTKCFNCKAILFSSNSPAGTSLAECSR